MYLVRNHRTKKSRNRDSYATYEDVKTDTKARAITVSYDSNFVKSASVSQGQSQERSFQTTDGKTGSKSFADTQSIQTGTDNRYERSKENSNSFIVGYSHGTVVTLNNESSDSKSTTTAEQAKSVCVTSGDTGGVEQNGSKGSTRGVGFTAGPVNGEGKLNDESGAAVSGSSSYSVLFCSPDGQDIQNVINAKVAQELEQQGTDAPVKVDPSDPPPRESQTEARGRRGERPTTKSWLPGRRSSSPKEERSRWRPRAKCGTNRYSGRY